ncbi:MAG: U32 family peptidase [Candidatus Omnitrophica bacterium]|nr:U32 family peptidase [Candidatus Omnitrophota bacterium]
MVKLLIPAGKEEIVYSAFENGADGVYIGPKNLSRRSSECELDDEAIKRCIDYANAHGKEIHIALNIHYQPSTIALILKKAERYIKWGASTIIATDLAVIKALSSEFYNTNLCASVSCAISNAEAARFYKDIGCTQIVAMINASADDVRKIKESVDINIEVFAHGCFDYNQCGHCWISTYLHSKKCNISSKNDYYFLGSLNRGGSCFRICQRPWKLCDNKYNVLREDYFNGAVYHFYRLERLLDYIKAGASYFKVQGRGYNAETVIEITRLYREALDQIFMLGEKFSIKDDLKARERKIEDIRLAAQNSRTDMLLGRAGMR